MNIKWTPTQKADACAEILAKVEKGLGLNTICKAGDDWLPTESVFRYWCDSDPDLFAKYTRAREVRAEVIFEECLAIADSQEGDVIIDADGNEMANHDMINRARLRIDTRKWMLGKMQPRVYGDKLDLNHGGSVKIEGVRMTFVDAAGTEDS